MTTTHRLARDFLLSNIVEEIPIHFNLTCKECCSSWTVILPKCSSYSLNYKCVISSGEKCLFDIVGLDINSQVIFGIRFKRSYNLHHILKYVTFSWVEVRYSDIMDIINSNFSNFVPLPILQLNNCYPFIKCGIDCLDNQEIGIHLGYIRRNIYYDNNSLHSINAYLDLESLYWADVFYSAGDSGSCNYNKNILDIQTVLRLWYTFLSRMCCLKCGHYSDVLMIGNPYCLGCQPTITGQQVNLRFSDEDLSKVYSTLAEYIGWLNFIPTFDHKIESCYFCHKFEFQLMTVENYRFINHKGKVSGHIKYRGKKKRCCVPCFDDQLWKRALVI
jgi:hypothetical protein